ncbi:tetratricopeptide repeat protein [Bacteroides sp. AN502(2024)]|uniref:tetratricopeptide repeat protein n=1 Tax=Bacteroides sp. AN502(2024) TaxID=3160599 RepID=UPI0035161E4A
MKRIIFVIVAGLFFATVYSQNKLSKEQIAEHYNNGTRYKYNKKYKEAFDEYMILAKDGFAMAEWEIAMCYYEGQGCQPNMQEYSKWMQRAAMHEFSRAYVEMGHIYYEGIGVAQNFQDAVKWYEKAANAGDALGAHCLGLAYHKGEGVAQDHKKAIYWYEKAVDGEKLSASANNIAMIYAKGGVGVERNLILAFQWFRRAADLGDRNAQYTLGLWYLDGSDKLKENSGCDECPTFSKDTTKALDYFKAAAAQGHVKAQIKVAEMTKR